MSRIFTESPAGGPVVLAEADAAFVHDTAVSGPTGPVVGQRLRLKRVPELTFFYDQSIEQGDRVERILQELKTERAARADSADDDTFGPRDDDQ